VKGQVLVGDRSFARHIETSIDTTWSTKHFSAYHGGYMMETVFKLALKHRVRHGLVNRRSTI
jgi:hypothetical protein